MPQGENELEFVGFRAEKWLDEEIQDLAWEHKMSKSELLRQICEYGVENIDQIIDDAHEGSTEP